MNNKKFFLLTLILLAACPPVQAAEPASDANLAGNEIFVSDDARFVLGTGLGIVRIDVNGKVTDKPSGGSWFVDLEGNLGLEEWSNVQHFYSAYRFNDRHSLLVSYFEIRRSSSLLDLDLSLQDLELSNARVEVLDTPQFYYLAYGYSLFDDDHSDITLIAGLNILDLNFVAEASGTISVGGDTRSAVDVVETGAAAPLPLVGLNFNTRFTPEWSVSTKVAFVTGSYDTVSALVLQTDIFSRYQYSHHVGLLLGLTYFAADVDEDKPDRLTQVSYQYNGLFLGLHFGL